MNKHCIYPKWIAILLVISLISGYSPALAASKSGVIGADRTPMRAAAKASAKVLYTLAKGTQVTVLSTKNGVARISYKSKKGYIKTSALQAQKAQPTKAPKIIATLTTTKNATLYKSAKTSSKKLKAIKKGVKVSVIGTKGNFKQVQISGKSGYMLASAFEVSKPAEATDMLTTQSAKLYQKKSTSAKSVSVKEGASVQVTSQSGKWSKVKVSGKSGYMLSESFVGTTLRKTRIYEKASAKSKSVALRSGAKVSVLSRDGDWYKVKSGKRKGYVKAAVLALPSAETAPEPAAPSPTKAQSVRKTTVKTYMYQKPSTSAKHVTIKAGSALNILADNGKWLKVRFRGKLGYVRDAAFENVPAPTPKPTPAAESSGDNYKTLKSGSKGDLVLKLQQRLEALGYLDSVPNAKYSASTVAAVKLFQKDSKLKANGIANAKTQQTLYDAGAHRSSIQSASLKKGSKGTQVKRLQLRLKAKGYYKGKVNGVYNEATESAVKAYQAQAGLKADGVAGRATLLSLFSGNAPAHSNSAPTQPAPATPAPTPEPTPAPTPTAAQNAPKPTPKPTAAPTAPPASASKKQKADQVIAAAMSKLGKPYVFGATGPNSYDCSGFTMYAYAVVGVKLPHSAYLQGYSCGTKVTFSQLQRGDLVCWDTSSDSDLSDHVGIYLGNGQAIHASSGTGKVIISTITSGYYQRAFSWGRDLL